jgi:outer membrane protein
MCNLDRTDTPGLRRVANATFALMLCAAPALSQQQPEGFSLGLGVVGSSGLYVGEDSAAMALPLLRYDSEAFSIGIPDGVRVTILERRDYRVSAVVSPRFSAIEASDAPELDGLDRAFTADGGVQARYVFNERTQLRFWAVTELTDEHSGSEVALSARHALPLGRVPLLFEGGVTWQSADLSGYLYGVSAPEATGTRPAYDPGDVLIPHLSVGTAIPITQKTRLVANIRADFLPDEVTLSPIVDEDVSVQGFLGISYSF